MNIQLPALSWFWQIQDNRPVKNVMTGSLGTNPACGVLRSTTFNYKVSANDEDQDNKFLEAEYYVLFPYSQELKRSEVKRRKFPFTKEGIEDAAAWLEAESLPVLALNTKEE